MTFTKNENGDWVSSYTFTSPGNYVLRTVRLDGVDYDLADTPTVTVNGFTVTALSCEEATNNHVNIMTVAGSTTVNLNLQFASDDVSKMPKKVQGRYLRDDDGSAVNIDFTYNATTKMWSGSATFLTSGDYTMEYLLLDGEYVGLDPAYQQTASVTLGMRVAVYTTSPHSFKYVPSEMADNEKLLGMQVKIMDNAGNEMPGLSGVKLTYGMKGSAVKTMDTDLTWNGNYYVGDLTTTGAGVWQFSNVTVGSNTLTNATSAPTFTILSPEPPTYYAHATADYQYKPNNDAVMNVQITNSSAAQVQALIVKSNGTETWVTGSLGNEFTTTDGKPGNNWNFQVPKDANGYQDGNWTLTQLRMWDVFAADGKAYTEESPLVIDLSNKNIVSKVVNRVYVTFTEDKSQDFGKDASGNVTGNFMDSYTISGLNVDIKDFENKPITGISDVQLTFAYQNGTSNTYGGYTSDSLTNATDGATINVALTDDGSGTRFAQGTDATIRYAGNYITTFSFTIGGTPVTYTGDNLPANTPVFTVSSVKPTVSITATSPSGSVNAYVSHTVTNYWVYRDVTITTTPYSAGKNTAGTEANVCYVATRDQTITYYYCNLIQPTVTITLSGYGNASGATLSFGDGAKIYSTKEGTTTAQYTWTGNGTCLRYIGLFDSISAGDDTRAIAGTITANNIVLTYDANGDGKAEVYNVSIPTITINNPY